MKRIWYELLSRKEFVDAGGTIDRACFGIFPAKDRAEEIASIAFVRTNAEIRGYTPYDPLGEKP